MITLFFLACLHLITSREKIKINLFISEYSLCTPNSEHVCEQQDGYSVSSYMEGVMEQAKRKSAPATSLDEKIAKLRRQNKREVGLVTG